MNPSPIPQHILALARANENRLGRAEPRRAVRDRRSTVAEIVMDPPACTVNMTLCELLGAQTRWGDVRSRKFLTMLRMSEVLTVGAMTQRQRRLVADTLSPSEDAEAA